MAYRLYADVGSSRGRPLFFTCLGPERADGADAARIGLGSNDHHRWHQRRACRAAVVELSMPSRLVHLHFGMERVRHAAGVVDECHLVLAEAVAEDSVLAEAVGSQGQARRSHAVVSQAR